MEVDDSLKPGRFSVSSRMTDTGGGAGVGSLVLPSGERIPLAREVITIGRMSDCAVSLTDTNVSRRHAEVRPSARGYVVADLGSTNGTKVNGTRVQGEQLLADGDIVSVGSTHLRFEAS
jgi:pSer/pThr/pTyr-binding forkhead associated (FHA) protein